MATIFQSWKKIKREDFLNNLAVTEGAGIWEGNLVEIREKREREQGKKNSVYI